MYNFHEELVCKWVNGLLFSSHFGDLIVRGYFYVNTSHKIVGEKVESDLQYPGLPFLYCHSNISLVYCLPNSQTPIRCFLLIHYEYRLICIFLCSHFQILCGNVILTFHRTTVRKQQGLFHVHDLLLYY